MKYEQVNHERLLFLTTKECIEAGIPEGTINNAKLRGSNSWLIIKDPGDLRVTLIGYEKLSDRNKEMVIARWGNPYNYITRQPIMNMVAHDDQAEQFFLQYRYNGDKILPIKRVKQYSRATCWLNLLKQVEESKKNQLIKDLGIKVPDFFTHLAALMEIEKINGASETYEGNNQLPAKFPTSYRNLRPKLWEYIDKGLCVLIDKMYGNQLAAKIIDEVSEAQLLELIENPLQYDDVLVCMMYNVWAKANGYKLIEPATVGVWRRKKESQIMIGREGNGAFNEKYIRQVKGLLPSTPLRLVEHDDNNLDFLFSDKDGYEFNKYVSICVVDSRLKLLLGKSYTVGQSPQQWQIYHAYLDAMYYIRSLTGGWYLPQELKADKWASKSLTPFYNKVARFIPPSHGNKHRGYIEQFFASPLWKRSQQLVAQNNWSGNNITARHRGVNNEVLRMNQKNRPLIGNQAETMIENFFHLLRNMPDFKRTDMKAPSKEEQFLLQWSELHKDDKRQINDEQFLLTFGIKHEPNGRSISINNRGVEPQIKNNHYSYDLPEPWMYNKYIGAKVNVLYDPFDMSRVLITNDDDIRFVAHTAKLQPRALKDQYTSSRTYLNAILAEKKDQVRQVSDASAARKRIVNIDHYNAEAMLQGGVLVKELKNDAEQIMIEQHSQGYEHYLDQNTDFNQFFDNPK